MCEKDYTATTIVINRNFKSGHCKITIRQATENDIPNICELAKQSLWSVGIINYKLYFHTSPKTWKVAVNSKGEIIAFSASNHMLVGARIGYQMLCKLDYQGYGITKYFDNMHYSRIPITANMTKLSICRYKFDILKEKLIGFTGISKPWLLNKPALNGKLQICLLTNDTIKYIFDYDYQVIGFDRQQFVKQWSMENGAKTLYCHNQQGQCCGYGTIRPCDEYFTIAPLYADDDDTAEFLFYHLYQKLPTGKLIYVFFPAERILIRKLVAMVQLSQTDTEFRVYQHKSLFVAEHLAMDKVYCMHDYWPV
ncbi:hypothetical protein T02_1425 [Trichinella nativa]|uniref:YitH/HolE acetyltransferase (GNAT) domain-containing protein n=3 Tax=Trichinella TaxID=6333 RepID=A0A0V1LQC2_9BILA|nr:hypothetical protein T05_867 [Trichinella murrelli]KRX63204.1 hypothetical protein T09_11670 [Trichinella sp. T9]KRX77159.1 hypothetical protein T06_9340 [Trichinella sp. T6]KRY09639.1 hypothetical protein T12_6007 [Trichinella patagoniensis]KRZ61701.1 hypothetical protein T02_1425 [Trichinella nativa]